MLLPASDISTTTSAEWYHPKHFSLSVFCFVNRTYICDRAGTDTAPPCDVTILMLYSTESPYLRFYRASFYFSPSGIVLLFFFSVLLTWVLVPQITLSNDAIPPRQHATCLAFSIFVECSFQKGDMLPIGTIPPRQYFGNTWHATFSPRPSVLQPN